MPLEACGECCVMGGIRRVLSEGRYVKRVLCNGRIVESVV